jgi:hypothetical protein
LQTRSGRERPSLGAPAAGQGGFLLSDPRHTREDTSRPSHRKSAHPESRGAFTFWLAAGGLGGLLIVLEATVVAPLSAGLKGNHALWLRYFLSLAMPLGTGIVSARLVRRGRWERSANRRIVVLVAGAQILLAVLLVIVAWREWRINHVFTLTSHVIAALCFVAGGLVALCLVDGTQLVIPSRVRTLFRAIVDPTLSASAVGIFTMVLTTIVALSLTIYTTATELSAPLVTSYHFPFAEEELTAILAGRVPDVNFVPQYVNFLGYLTAPWFSLFGTSIGSFTTVMALLSAIAFLSIGFVFRLVVGNWLLAALLYVPFLSLAMVPGYRYRHGVVTVANYPALMPFRYLGPFVLLAVVALVLRRPRARWWFVVGALSGLVLANNLDFGLAAAAAALAASIVGGTELSDRSWRFPAVVALGTAVGFLSFWIALWGEGGSFPSVHQYLFFAVDLGAGGIYSARMGTIFGIQLVLWCTYAACVAIPLFRWLRGQRRDQMTRLRDGLLAFVGVFGFGSGLYYVNRALQSVVVGLIVTWAIAATLLAWEVVLQARAQVRTHGRLHWTAAFPLALAIAFYGLAVGSLTDGRNLVGHFQLITSTQKTVDFLNPSLIRAIESCTPRGEHVVLMVPESYSVALQAGVSNWMPYNNPGTVATKGQMTYLEQVVQRENVGEVYFLLSWPVPFVKYLGSKGWVQSEVRYAGEPASGMVVVRKPDVERESQSCTTGAFPTVAS